MIEHIISGERVLAIIIPHDFTATGVNFITPHNFSQQLAFINHPPGKLIEPHSHNPVFREVLYTQEVLVIKKGVLKVDFYDDNRTYLESRILRSGDVILLADGGHGFEVLEEIEMIEVKQGPYAGDNDKTRFMKVSE
jgi:mannose-6-phosphate isomerase-like protein (cupin superfamily)